MKPKLSTFANVMDLSRFSYQWISDLIYFEGPLLSMVNYTLDGAQHKGFVWWYDNDDLANRWLFFKVSEDTERQYRDQQISLRDIMLNNPEAIAVDIADNLQVVMWHPFLITDLPEDDLPTEDSFSDPILLR